MKIGVFDSGIGGLSIINRLVEVLPKENFIFFEDSLNNPYGEKTDEELRKIVSKVVDYLLEQDCKLIVIACNTATTRCISYLRNKYKDIVFVGTEPAIKVACDNNYENILVMATPATISSERTHFLVDNNKKEFEKVYLVSCDGLANAIEFNREDDQERIIKNIYEEYKDMNIDAIVLGCTHYPLIKDKISKYFKDVVLLDGSDGVARECKRQLKLNNLVTDSGNANVLIVNSKNG